MSLADVVKAVAPTLATALGGPLAGAVVSFVADKMGVQDATLERIQQILAQSDPVRLRELDLDFQKFMAEHGIRLQLAQIEVNREEARSINWFVAGGRPACIWIGAFGLGYAAVLEPLLRFIAKVVFGYEGEFPAIDTMITMQILFGLLGLGAYRTYEKTKGVEARH
jgi:hypothetical protein